MRFIEDLRDKYKNEEIWILGSGPSLDDYPDNFFENKIFIEINWIFFAFPPLKESQYILTTHFEPPKYLMAHNPEFLKQCILGLPLATGRERWEADLLGAYKNDPIYFRWHFTGGRDEPFLKYFESTIQSIMKGEACKYVCLTTNVHYAIQMAVILGAKKIILAGCDGKLKKNRERAIKRGLAPYYHKKKRRGAQPEKPQKWQFGTKLFSEAFKPYGITVRKYFYNTGYKEIL